MPLVNSQPVYDQARQNQWLTLVVSFVGTLLYWTIQADLVVVMMTPKSGSHILIQFDSEAAGWRVGFVSLRSVTRSATDNRRARYNR